MARIRYERVEDTVSKARKTVVSFGDAAYNEVPDGYKGLNWDNFQVTNSDYNGHGHVAEYIDYGPSSFSIESGSFELKRMTLAADVKAQALRIDISAFSDGTLVYTKDIIIHDHLQNVRFHWKGVDNVVIMSYPTKDTTPGDFYYELRDITLDHVTSSISPSEEAAHLNAFGVDQRHLGDWLAITLGHADLTHLAHLT